MPIPFSSFSAFNAPQTKTDYSGIVNMIPQAFQTYRGVMQARETPYELRHQRMMNEEKLQKAAFENALMQQFGVKEKEADIAYKLALAQHALNPMTTTQRDLAAIYGGDTEAFQNALKQQYGIPRESGEINTNELAALGIPHNVIGSPLQGLPANEQNRVMQTMETGLTAAIEKTNALESLNTLDDIMNRSPHLWKSFQTILREPRDENELKKFIKTRGLSEKDATDIDIFNKISNELALQAGMSLGNKNFTDAKLKALQMTKPDIKNTPAANKFVTQRLRHLFETGPAEQRAYQYGLKNRVRIIQNPEAFRAIGKEESMPQAEPVRLGVKTGAEGTIKGVWQGQEVDVPFEDVEEFKADGGVISGG